MSLRHGLLGLLDQKPATGYELTKSFEQIGQWAWHASHSHIYPELRRMTEAGLVEVVEEQSRGRKTYAVTQAGRAELRRWMLDPAEETVRSAAALRMFLIGSLEPDDARAFLRAYIDNTDDNLARLRAQLDEAGEEWRADPLAVGRLAAERALYVLPAVREWAVWALEQLDGSERVEGEGTSRRA
ncbi:PadR family transcriptional regulator [Kribbella sp. NPDC023855]|jgi:DNA-binding PadR family transcriptional regulator|uniref:PadR family transcriptional regulator n=1 Tax=Kribbella sp. NPDC023855 TaxID=3154698 RepID=UPI0033FBFADB